MNFSWLHAVGISLALVLVLAQLHKKLENLYHCKTTKNREEEGSTRRQNCSM